MKTCFDSLTDDDRFRSAQFCIAQRCEDDGRKVASSYEKRYVVVQMFGYLELTEEDKRNSGAVRAVPIKLTAIQIEDKIDGQ